jgi:nucleotide-binding universal stress UspA family protein
MNTSVVDERPARTPVRFASVLCVAEFDRAHPDTLTAASRAALRHAAAVALPCDGRVTVLHVLPMLPQPVVIAGGAVTDLTAEEPRVRALVTERLRKAVAAERAPGTIDVRVVRGRPVDEIEHAAAALDADLIIAGYQDRPGGYTEGFSFRALLHRATRPVVVTRATDGAGAGWEP